MADEALDLASYLEQLEAQRATLNIQIAGVRHALGLPPEGETATATAIAVGGSIKPIGVIIGKVRSDEFFRMSIPEAVKRYLEIMKQPQPPAGIVKALQTGGVLTQSKNFYTTVWTALKRLRAAGEIVNTPSGWGLSVWYPNKPKPGAEEKKPKKGKRKRNQKRTKSQRPAVTKKPPKTKTAAAAPKQTGGWKAFLADQLRAGKTMKEASEAYKKRGAES